MTAIGKTAHVSLSNATRAKFNEGEIPTNAYVVWEIALKAARNRGHAKDYKGIQGYEAGFTMTSMILAAFPELKPVDPDEVDLLVRPIRQFLNQTTNAVCTNRGSRNTDRRDITWWIRGTWNDTGVVTIHGGTNPKGAGRPYGDLETRIAQRERKLTPAEAGEDRAPEPVTVTKAPTTPSPMDRVPEGSKLSPREAIKVARDTEAAVLKILRDYREPLSTTEIINLGTGMKRVTTRNAIRRLLADDKILELTHTQAKRNILRAGAKYYAMKSWRATPKRKSEPVTPEPEEVKVPAADADNPPVKPEELKLSEFIAEFTRLESENARLREENAELKAFKDKILGAITT